MPTSPITLGDHLRRCRIGLGLFQKNVAARLSLSSPTIWNWENTGPVYVETTGPDWFGKGGPLSVGIGGRNPSEQLNLAEWNLWGCPDEKHPDEHPDKLLQTFQHRVKHRQAMLKPDNPIMFRQTIPPAQQDLSDFIHPRVAIIIAGQPFSHLDLSIPAQP